MTYSINHTKVITKQKLVILEELEVVQKILNVKLKS